MNFYKIGMYFVNLMCLVLAVSTIIAGYAVMMRFQAIHSILSGISVHMPSSVLYSTGLAIFVLVVTVGCVGTAAENGTLLFMYSFFMLFLVIIQIGLACFAVLQVDHVKINLTRTFKQQFTGVATNNTKSMTYFEKVERTLQCCGLNNYMDYKYGLPDSCCGSAPPCSPTDVHQVGCVNAMSIYLHNVTEMFSGVCIVSAMLQFFVVVYVGFFADKVKMDGHEYFE